MRPWPGRGDEPIDWGDEPPEPPPPPSAGRSLRLGVLAVYDYIGSTIVASLVAFVLFYTAAAPLFSAVLQLATPGRGRATVLIAGILLLAPLILAPLTAGLFGLTRAMFRRDDPHVLDVWRGARRYAGRALALGYAQALITTILVGDTVFLLLRPGAALKVLGVFVSYALLFWAMTLTYQWTLLVDRDKPLWTTLRNAAVLALANPFYTLAVTVICAVLVVAPLVALLAFGVAAAAAVLVPVALFVGVLVPALQTSATLEILRKYEEPEGAETES